MIQFILNDQLIQTDAPPGTALLDFIRKDQQLKGAKLVCKEGECGACSVMVGKLEKGTVFYQSMTSCITPLVNAHGKHIVSIEGFNMEELTPVQQAMVDSYGTQCGFCTPGFVVSLSGYLLSNKTLTKEGIIAAIDGNICRCTGYKSIERAAGLVLEKVKKDLPVVDIEGLVKSKFIPAYFMDISSRLKDLEQATPQNGNAIRLGGGTDLYVQKPVEMYESDHVAVYDNSAMNQIEIADGFCSFGAAVTMGDLYRSELFNQALPDSDYIFKLLSSTQIRNMATIGGNLVNASPIGDFTILLLALDSEITLEKNGNGRSVSLKEFYKGYKKMDMQEGEVLTKIKFKIPGAKNHFHFEKVSQRKYFDIASVNLAGNLTIEEDKITTAHMAVGGVGPVPMYLQKTCSFLEGKKLAEDTIDSAIEVLNNEITPISDARGSADYKRLLARQLFIAQFLEVNPGLFNLKKLIGQ